MIDTTKTIREVRYNGTAIPLLGGVDNPIVVTSDAEMDIYLNDDKYLGMYVKFNGESENYLNGQVYKIAQEGEMSKFYKLPTLDNEGTAADLAKGKQLINGNGELITGTTIIENKLNQYLRRTITEVTEDDLMNITDIANNAFYGRRSLASVTIPESIVNIGFSAFENCSSLEKIVLLSITPPTLGSNAFANISSNAIITVPRGSLNAYQTATNWSTYADKMVEASN